MTNEESAPKGNQGQFSSPTIYDIAELAGVNPSTVSRALNKPGRINAKTEAKIRQAAEHLNYRANPMARSLPTGRTRMLALFVADITNPVFFDVVRGAESAASSAGYTTIIAESQESASFEASAIERIIPAVDGVILATSRLADAEIQKLAKQKPLVLMNRKVPGVLDLVSDVKPGVDQAIAHLSELGHKRIAFVAGPENAWISQHRWELILDSAIEHELNVVSIGSQAPTFEGGREAFKRVRASGVTAVITYNDLVAIGLMKQAQESGLKIPEDLSIIGFDDIFGTTLTTPEVTTIKTPLENAGHLAVSELLRLCGDDVQQPAQAGSSLKTELIIRGSTAVGN